MNEKKINNMMEFVEHENLDLDEQVEAMIRMGCGLNAMLRDDCLETAIKQLKHVAHGLYLHEKRIRQNSKEPFARMEARKETSQQLAA